MVLMISELEENLFPPNHFFKFVKRNHRGPYQESGVDERAIPIIIQPI